MKAGIVVYRRSGGWLIGKWTHDAVGGVLQREIVQGSPGSDWQGDWPVEIFQGGKSIFKGRFSSVELGESLKLAWNTEDGATAYQGIGFALDAETLAATFESVGSESDSRVTAAPS
jgi:hypothetical protein